MMWLSWGLVLTPEPKKNIKAHLNNINVIATSSNSGYLVENSELSLMNAYFFNSIL